MKIKILLKIDFKKDTISWTLKLSITMKMIHHIGNYSHSQVAPHNYLDMLLTKYRGNS